MPELFWWIGEGVCPLEETQWGTLEGVWRFSHEWSWLHTPVYWTPPSMAPHYGRRPEEWTQSWERCMKGYNRIHIVMRQRANLSEDHVGGKLLLHTFSPLQWKSEGVKISHHSTDVPAFHKSGQSQLRLAMQEVELNVQACALLRQNVNTVNALGSTITFLRESESIMFTSATSCSPLSMKVYCR